MSKKYVIELDDRIKLVTSVGVTENGVVYTTSDYVHNLEELNSDYINEHFGDLQDTAYQRGLDDAWEAARKIAAMWETMDNDDLLETFGVTAKIGESVIGTLFKKQTANEAMLKLEAYEEKQKADDEIEVGDEVNWLGDCFIVTRIFQPRNMKEQCDGIGDDGCVYSNVLIDDLEKTGRHFDIASILEDMKHD